MKRIHTFAQKNVRNQVLLAGACLQNRVKFASCAVAGQPQFGGSGLF
jgi:hypothetical protein